METRIPFTRRCARKEPALFYRSFFSERDEGATAEYPAYIFPDPTCAHIFKERDMCRNKLTQVAGYSAVKLQRSCQWKDSSPDS